MAMRRVCYGRSRGRVCRPAHRRSRASFGDVKVRIPKSARYALELDNDDRWPGLEQVGKGVYRMPEGTARSLYNEARIRGMRASESGYDEMTAKDRAAARRAAANLAKALGR